MEQKTTERKEIERKAEDMKRLMSEGSKELEVGRVEGEDEGE